MKRLLDIVVAVFGLAVTSPIILPVMFLIWWGDRHSPFYIAARMGRGNKPFRMVKLRSMRVGADRSGVDSTAAGDTRITPVGHFVRRYKLDEVVQLWNVLKGDMSLVGPRPNVERETNLYTAQEQRLLSVRPGITDFSSIVFADEAEILDGRTNPDLAYNQLIRPWKSRLGLFYIDNANVILDIKLVVWTATAILSRPAALRNVAGELRRRGAPTELVAVALRESDLVPTPPPGATSVVTAR